MPKRIRINSDSNIHFVTFAVYKHVPVFRNSVFAEEFLNNLQYYCNKRRCKLFAFVIMPHHVHLLLELKNQENISDFIRDVKKYFSYEVKDLLLRKTNFNPESFNAKGRFQFWERGFDEVTIITEKMFQVKLKYIHNNPVKEGIVNRAEDYLYSSAGRKDLICDRQI